MAIAQRQSPVKIHEKSPRPTTYEIAKELAKQKPSLIVKPNEVAKKRFSVSLVNSVIL